MAQTHQLSQAAHDRLSAELEDLTTRGRIDIARKIEAARELGDLSENGDYHAAKEEQGRMEGRIAHLSRVLTDATIISAEDAGAAGSVGLGSVVSVVFEGDSEPERLLVGVIEERRDDDLTVVSPGSPMGKALLGAVAGESVEFELPDERSQKVTVVEVA